MKILALSLLTLVVLLQYHLWVSGDGMREVWRLRREVAAQTAQNDKLQERNRTLAAEVQDLKKGKAAIEERARTDLGMVGDKETFFEVAPKQMLPADAPTTTTNKNTPMLVNNREASGNGATTGTAAPSGGFTTQASQAISPR